MATKRRIGDILERLKNPVEIQDTEFYTRLTIRINHQGVSVRDNVIGASIGTKSQFYVRAGDFILSKIDARQGAFGIVPPEADGGIITGNFWTYRVDNQLVDINWFLQFTNSDSFLDLCKRSSTGNTHRKYLNESIFLDHVLAIPSLDEQRKSVAACRSGSKQVEDIQHEITHQQSLLAKLKQAILQEAIEGKLTSDWRASHPEVEPARELLHRIQAEKASLIAAKKIKTGARQGAVDDRQNTPSIPPEWELPHLDDVSMLITDGTHQTPTYTPTGRIFLSAQNVKPFRFMPEQHKFVSEKAFAEYTSNHKAERGDLLLGRVGAGIGETAVIDRDLDFAYYVSLGLVKTFKEYTVPQYLAIVFNSPYGIRYAKGNTSSKGGSAGNFNLGRIRSFRIPLPPLAEQFAIVERVESLMATCRALESEIEQTRTHAAHLLQAVLKEAFAPAST